MKKDVATIVTDRIIEALEKGIAPWARPWKRIGGVGPTSFASGKPYRGINVLILEATAMLEGYTSQYWVTYNQAKKLGGNVRKDEKGTPVVLWKPIRKENEAGEVEREYLLMRYFTVFNLDQCEGIEAPDVPELEPFVPLERAQELADHMPHRPEVRHGGDAAFYSPTLDRVQMPLAEAFAQSEDYYGVLFHELAHSTGHKSRLDRAGFETAVPFGSEVYAKEELVAEIAAAIVCAEAQIEPNIERSAAYVESWLKYATDNRDELLKAASAAQKAADAIIGKEESS
jgi:antirestriction protein ArdC